MTSCPVCLEIIGKAKTTLECGHEMCSGCWSACVATGNWTCPCCRGAVGGLEGIPNTAKLIVSVRNARNVIGEQRDELMDLATSRGSEILGQRSVIRESLRREGESLRRVDELQDLLERQQEGLAETIGQLQKARRKTQAVMRCNVALEHELDEAQEIAVLDAAISAGCDAKIEKLEARVRFAEFCADRRSLTIGKLTANIASAATRAKTSPCEIGSYILSCSARPRFDTDACVSGEAKDTAENSAYSNSSSYDSDFPDDDDWGFGERHPLAFIKR